MKKKVRFIINQIYTVGNFDIYSLVYTLRLGIPIGIVTAIAAPASIKVEFEGNGGHAGAVLMPARFAYSLPSTHLIVNSQIELSGKLLRFSGVSYVIVVVYRGILIVYANNCWFCEVATLTCPSLFD